MITAGSGRPLPRPLTPFVDRRVELQELRRLLADNRLVCLIGPAGTGKTRLAMQLAADLQRHFQGAVWFVELATLAEPDLLAAHVVRAVGMVEEARSDVDAQLLEELEDKRGLLVLDNCEHLVDPAARLCDRLLRSCREIQVVATSRERLGVPGELVWRVGPLGVPEPGRNYSREALARIDSITLFLDRASRSRPDFTLTAENSRSVAELAWRLEGIPLAVELAAAWTSTLAPADLLARLDDRFQLLKARDRTVTPRHASLRAAIDSSYHSLGEREKRLFRRLGLFAGGWSLEAVSQVWGLEPTAAVELLGRLVDRSFVSVRVGPLGQSRYWMLDSLREYALHRLQEGGELVEAQRAYAEYFSALAVTAAENLNREGGRWLELLDTEHDNCRAVLELDPPPDPALRLRMTVALAEYWRMRGYFTEARLRLVEAVRRSTEPTRELAAALRALGMMAWYQGDQDVAERHTRKALVTSRKLSDMTGVLLALQLMAQISYDSGRTTSARLRLERGLDIARGVNDPFLLASHYLRLGQIAIGDRQWEEARGILQQCVDLSRQIGHTELAALATIVIGRSYIGQGRPELAEPLLRQALVELRSFGGPRHVAPALESLAAVAAQRGDTGRAARLAGAADRLNRQVGARPPSTSPMRAFLAAQWKPTIAARGGERAWAEGSVMDLQEAVRYALREEEPGQAQATRPSKGPVLTRRQLEIARLVVEGLTNRDIATRLFISERTAEGHVEQIRNRLGLSSRVQIAAWLVENEPPSGQGPR